MRAPAWCANICAPRQMPRNGFPSFSGTRDPVDLAADEIGLVGGAHRSAEDDRAGVSGHGCRQRVAIARTADVEGIAALLQRVSDPAGRRVLLVQYDQDRERHGERGECGRIAVPFLAQTADCHGTILIAAGRMPRLACHCRRGRTFCPAATGHVSGSHENCAWHCSAFSGGRPAARLRAARPHPGGARPRCHDLHHLDARSAAPARLQDGGRAGPRLHQSRHRRAVCGAVLRPDGARIRSRDRLQQAHRICNSSTAPTPPCTIATAICSSGCCRGTACRPCSSATRSGRCRPRISWR